MENQKQKYNDLYNEGSEGYNPYDYVDESPKKENCKDKERRLYFERSTKKIQEQQNLIDNYSDQLSNTNDPKRINWLKQSLENAIFERDFLMSLHKEREQNPNFLR